MAGRKIAISEARRRLPELVREVAAQGGRVDITVRGTTQASLIRAEDLAELGASAPGGSRRPAALAIDFLTPPETLVNTLRELRSRIGRPRQIGGRARARRGR